MNHLNVTKSHVTKSRFSLFQEGSYDIGGRGSHPTTGKWRVRNYNYC